MDGFERCDRSQPLRVMLQVANRHCGAWAPSRISQRIAITSLYCCTRVLLRHLYAGNDGGVRRQYGPKIQISPQTPLAGGAEETPLEPLPQHRDPAILALTHLPPHAGARRRREATASLTGLKAACVTEPLIEGRMAQGLQEHQDKARHGFLYIFAESSRLYLRNCSSISK
jgi:hypothetical protein